ncbi:MAG: class I mannose-6-phosphate isomerase [Planctomycetes bacterium]|nr:class I mannose-6-phosphate isomerase [Planctomycetota bacterium]
MKLSPLVFEPIYKEKVWGGRSLERLGKRLPAGVNVGESWELADLASTSADGGGGDSAHSKVARGGMRGMTIREALMSAGANILGSTHAAPGGAFPLLVKYLDAKENLSVQVHPSPAYAAAHPGAHLKTESWYIVDAAPGAVIYKGVKAGVTREAFERHVREGTVVDDLVAVPVKAGDFHHLPSGTCHALGAGVLVAEVQTPSDTTYRVFDWGRQGRALHLERALECIRFAPADADSFARADGAARMLLCTTDFYSVAEVNMKAREPHTLRIGGRAPRVWMVLSGGGSVVAERGEFDPVALNAGDTALFPASMPAAVFTASGACRVLEVLLPHH